MFNDVYRQYKRNLALKMMLFGILAGLVYALLSDGYQAVMPITNGIVTGILLGGFVAFFELYWLTPAKRRQYPFLKILFIRVAAYSLVIVTILFLVFSISRVFWKDISYLSVLQSEEFQRFIFEEDFITVIFYAIGLSLLLTFTIQVSRKLGQGYLFNVISGKYFQPKLTQRTFLFINLLNIREVIEMNGHEKSFEFVNDFLYSSTQAILFHKAKIHHYVDNQMVLFWNDAESIGLSIQCFFALHNLTRDQEEYFLNTYGIVPHINGGIHSGSIVQAEIGTGKTEIAFYGDVINTTARIAAVAHARGSVLCDTSRLRNAGIKGEPIGEIALAGKSESIHLESLDHAT